MSSMKRAALYVRVSTDAQTMENQIREPDSTFSKTHLYHAKSAGHSPPLNHRKSDSYAAPAAQRP